MTLSEKSSGKSSQVVAESAWTKAQIINISAAKHCQVVFIRWSLNLISIDDSCCLFLSLKTCLIHLLDSIIKQQKQDLWSWTIKTTSLVFTWKMALLFKQVRDTCEYFSKHFKVPCSTIHTR